MNFALNNLQRLICYKIQRNKQTYQMLPLLTGVDQGAIAIKGYSSFPKAPALLEPHHRIV